METPDTTTPLPFRLTNLETEIQVAFMRAGQPAYEAAINALQLVRIFRASGDKERWYEIGGERFKLERVAIPQLLLDPKRNQQPPAPRTSRRKAAEPNRTPGGLFD